MVGRPRPSLGDPYFATDDYKGPELPLLAQREAALFRLTTLLGVTPAQAPQAARDCAVIPRVEGTENMEDLRAGMSVVVTIDTGHVRHVSDLLPR